MIHKTNANSQGFTLIELLVVISIIGLLSSIVVGSLSSARKRAEAAKIVQEINQLKTALELYKNDHGVYPNEGTPDYKCFEWCEDPVSYFNGVLVSGKYIPSVSNPATLPQGMWFSVPPMLYATGGDFYLYYEAEGFYGTCGGRKLKGYLLEFYNEMDLNLPKAGFCFDDSCVEAEPFYGAGNNDHWYCIGE